MSEPCISSQAHDLFVCALIVAILALLILAKGLQLIQRASRVLQDAALGGLLLKACAGDRPAALKAIDSTRMCTEEFKAALGWPHEDTQ